MTRLADILSSVFETRYANSKIRDGRPIEELCEDLLSTRGDVSGSSLARQILDRFAGLDEEEKSVFFNFLAEKMDVDTAAIAGALDAYRDTPSSENYRALMDAVEPRRQEFFRRLNRVPGATENLVQMRTDLLKRVRQDSLLGRVDIDLRHLFASWFNRGFLVLRPISWDTSASVLERIIEYEAVHAIRSWEDLGRRLRPGDRRCFAFFHPSMPADPLIFVEVALTQGIPNSVQALLAEDRAAVPVSDADTAVFYSISNCQPGLAQISLGNSLIKQVVEELRRELPQVKVFVTLSPIPTLGRWLEREGRSAADDEALRQQAAYYLLRAKRPDGLPEDPVARFHLFNGASIFDVHASADTSPAGMERSLGAMVNYRYDLARITRNHEAFADKGTVVAARPVQALARAAVSETNSRESGS